VHLAAGASELPQAGHSFGSQSLFNFKRSAFNLDYPHSLVKAGGVDKSFFVPLSFQRIFFGGVKENRIIV